MKLCFFDVETTGLDPYRDRIVEIAMEVYEDVRHIDTPSEIYHGFVNPGRSIPPEATDVHAITDEDVRDAPTFMAIASDVRRMVEGAVLVGYNSRTFDTVILHCELKRAGKAGLPCDENGSIVVREIDLLEVWRQAEPRTLVGAAKRFAQVDHETHAHGALADVRVLMGVGNGMAAAFGLSPEDMMRLSVPEYAVDRDGKFRRENGVIVFGFGKHKGEPASEHTDYLEWLVSKDFSPETKAYAVRIIQGELS